MRTPVVLDTTGDQLLALGALLSRSGKTIESEISGSSMGNTLPSGCHIRIRPLPVEEYQAGQVVAFVAGGSLFAHRIVYRSGQSVLTRGDNHSWCDLPLRTGAIIGVVSEYLAEGEWRLFDGSAPFEHELGKRRRFLEFLLRACLRIDIRLAQRASRMLMLLARWRRNMFQPGEPAK
jgi:hypothetical protein